MEYQEALKIVENAIAKKEGRALNNVEIAIFQGSWEGLTYDEIAKKSDYEVNYLKGDAGHKFWRLLSEALGDRITKSNFQSVLESKERHDLSVSIRHDIHLEYLSPESDYKNFKTVTLQPSELLRIQGKPRIGKTWLLARLINFASSKDYKSVYLSLKLAEKGDNGDYKDLNSFLFWLCISVHQMLTLEDLSQKDQKDWWDKQLGNSKLKAIRYIEKYCLFNDKPLILGLDNLDEVFDYPEIAVEFLSWLRSLYEKAKTSPVWAKLLLILAYREKFHHLPEDISPFNVGLKIELTESNQKHIEILDDSSL